MFVEDYSASLISQYETAKANNELNLDMPSNLSVVVPETPSSCDAVVNPIKEQIDAKVAEFNDRVDCTNYLADRECSAIATQVDAILADNAGLADEILARNAALLNDLFLTQAEEGEDLTMFEVRMQTKMATSDDPPMVESDVTTPTANLPTACEDYTSYDTVN